MATFNDLNTDWTALSSDPQMWSDNDLQLAAELGKTLLNRNKELETSLRSYQSMIDEQAQEIEYMKKQIAALREVNDSRLKVYEHVEISVHDLECANRRLVSENSTDKKLIKSQLSTIRSLEMKCEELQKDIDELKSKYDKLVRLQQRQNENLSEVQAKDSIKQDGSIDQTAARSSSRSSPMCYTDGITRKNSSSSTSAEDEVIELLQQLQDIRSQRAREQKKINDLREQVDDLMKENTKLEDELRDCRYKAGDIKSLQEELSNLQEVRQGQLCGRCLRSCDSGTQDEVLSFLDPEEDDSLSLAESSLTESHRELDSLAQELQANGFSPDKAPNPYNVLVEKYEALLEVQRQLGPRKRSIPQGMSLQDELKMSGDYGSFQARPVEADKPKDNETITTTSTIRPNRKKPSPATPTDFSEAETASSGFSDEISNKGTQTDDRFGLFLCSITEDDCKLSIYDDTSSFESRFIKMPQYREVFKEIFGVLKQAAAAKAEGQKLSVINNGQSAEASYVPDQSTDNDDTVSVMSSVISSAVSEPIIKIQSPSPRKIAELKQNSGASTGPNNKQPPRTFQQYDYLSVQVKKRNPKKNGQRKLNYESKSTNVVGSQNSQIASAEIMIVDKKSKSGQFTRADGTSSFGHGMSIQLQSRKIPQLASSYKANVHNNHNSNKHTSSAVCNKDYKPSTASEDVARLRRLEMSYAQALRMPNKPKAINLRKH